MYTVYYNIRLHNIKLYCSTSWMGKHSFHKKTSKFLVFFFYFKHILFCMTLNQYCVIFFYHWTLNKYKYFWKKNCTYSSFSLITNAFIKKNWFLIFILTFLIKRLLCNNFNPYKKNIFKNINTFWIIRILR